MFQFRIKRVYNKREMKPGKPGRPNKRREKMEEEKL